MLGFTFEITKSGIDMSAINTFPHSFFTRKKHMGYFWSAECDGIICFYSFSYDFIAAAAKSARDVYGNYLLP